MQAPTSFTGDEPVGGRYELAEQVGEGNFAVTYRAHDRVLGRTVAVKMLRAQYAADPTFVARFEREARVAASVSHPNVVDVYDFGAYRDTYFIAMQYVLGRTLKDDLEARGPLPAAAAVRTTGQILRGLGAIHAAGIVHRDIKPQNVLLGPDRVARVTDFGVAHYPVQGALTTHGTTVGTAAYMAPEQARGAALGETADLYSVGVVLFELLTGRLPFEGDNPMAVMLAHLQQPPPQLSEVAPEVEVPPALEAEVMRALAKDPAARRASADEMANALDLSLADRRVSSEAVAMRWTDTGTATRQMPVAAGPAALPPARAAVAAPSRTAVGSSTAASPRQIPQASLPPIRSRRRGTAWLAPVALFGLALAALGGLAASGADLVGFGGGTGEPTSIAVVTAPDPTESSPPPPTASAPSSAPIVLQVTPVPTPAPTGDSENETIGAAEEPTPSRSLRATATRAPDPTASVPTVATMAPLSPIARNTPAPTVTPRPTSTPRPTPSPAPSPAPSPTATMVPTATPTPIPPEPTATEAPTATATTVPVPVAVDRGASGVVGGNLPGPAPATEPPPQPVPVEDVPSDPTAAPVETDDVDAEPTAAPVERDGNALGFLSGPGVTFFDAQEWRGAMNADAVTYGKQSVAIYGVDSGSSRATLSFTLEEPISRMDLWLSGQGDETGTPFQFALVVNGTQSQPITSPFPQWNGRSPSWSAVPFSIGRDLLRAGTNTISVVSLQPGAHEGVPPYLLLAEASLAPADAAVNKSAPARGETVKLISPPAVAEGDANAESKKSTQDPKDEEKGSRENENRGRGNGGGDDRKKDED